MAGPSLFFICIDIQHQDGMIALACHSQNTGSFLPRPAIRQRLITGTSRISINEIEMLQSPNLIDDKIVEDYEKRANLELKLRR